MDPRLVPKDPKSQALLPVHLRRNIPPGSVPTPLKPTSSRFRGRKLKENILGITCPSIRRLARRGGVIRIKQEIYNETRKVLRKRLEDILRIAIWVAEHPKHPSHFRKTIIVSDIIYALRHLGIPLYGFDQPSGAR